MVVQTTWFVQNKYLFACQFHKFSKQMCTHNKVTFGLH